MKREKAVAVGNRAGVVEWANAAWSRVTGYALEDAIAKPIGDLLDIAGIESDVIGFVRQRFERGEPCEIELPLEPPSGEQRWIHVSVESLRDRFGEVSHFAAIAWDVTAEKHRAAETPAIVPTMPARAQRDATPLQLSTTDVSALVRDVLNEHETDGAPRTAFDLALPGELPWVGVDRELVGDAVAGLVRDAVAAIGDEWGTVSLNTGVVQSEGLFVSPTYPRNCLVRGLPEGHYVYIEIHDTGLPVDRTAVSALSGVELPASAKGRVARLAAARLLLQDHGGELRVDADAGFGTRAILLFPC